MNIEACINCGSRNIRFGDISDGVLPGYTDALASYVCNDCNHQGIPIVFNSEKEYKKFVEALEADESSD